ncbi:MAG: hypothetical protein ACXVFV_13645, partial [Mycobacteriales bacterium]
MRLDRSRPLVLGTALLVLAGCGSTVQVRSTATGVLGDGLSQAQPGAAAPGSAGAVAGTTGTAASTGAVASAPTAAGATAAGAAGAQGGGGATAGPGVPTQGLGAQAATGGIPPTGRGWDRTHVYIGVTTQKDAQAAFANAGASGIDPGDQEGDANAVVAELNRRGGLFGRRIQVVFKDESTVSTAQDPNTAGSAACTYFTQDHPVVALLNPVTLMDVPSFRACMAKAHVPLLSASVAAVDDQVG